MSRKPKQIAIYGKGGIGKSTTTSNISAALAEAGYKVMQFGCDPKADSTNTLRNGEYIPSVLDLLAEKRRVDARQAVFKGFGGIKSLGIRAYPYNFYVVYLFAFFHLRDSSQTLNCIPENTIVPI